jgi:hypothetical protein
VSRRLGHASINTTFQSYLGTELLISTRN